MHVQQEAVSHMLCNDEQLRGMARKVQRLAAREAAVSAALPPSQVAPTSPPHPLSSPAPNRPPPARPPTITAAHLCSRRLCCWAFVCTPHLVSRAISAPLDPNHRPQAAFELGILLRSEAAAGGAKTLAGSVDADEPRIHCCGTQYAATFGVARS